jgi:hypothetical protein
MRQVSRAKGSTMHTRWTMLLPAALLMACEGADQPPRAEPISLAAYLPATVAGNRTGDKERSMANCPSTVGGAVSTAEARADGMVLTIRAKSPAAIGEIRSRASRHAGVRAQPDTRLHTGLGTGGGAIGHCPIVHEDTMVTVAEVAGGVAIAMQPLNPDARDSVRALVLDRLAALEAPDLADQ